MRSQLRTKQSEILCSGEVSDLNRTQKLENVPNGKLLSSRFKLDGVGKMDKIRIMAIFIIMFSSVYNK